MRILIWLLLIYIGYRIVKAIVQKKAGDEPADSSVTQREETYQDPVCGTYVAEDDAVIGRVEGERVYFCSMACLEKFREGLEHK
ncbi:transcriptional regulator [Geobacter sp.]|uniref:transcriptional regulator n=1 Tax=Geobacter sp. TaxID=46610 RepID=UPI00262AC95F|nr:transcriptional regulator [Geobacter sp.]